MKGHFKARIENLSEMLEAAVPPRPTRWYDLEVWNQVLIVVGALALFFVAALASALAS